MDTFRVARVGIHHFEEPCISGEKGSGTIFFSGCNLKCVFCQNSEISHENKGLELSQKQLIYAMEHLVDLGAENINLVTPSKYTQLLQEVLKVAREHIKVPFVWNSSGYESVASLKKMEGLVDIYMPDMKYSDDELAMEYSHAKNYFEVSQNAIVEMRRQCPTDIFADGMMKSGMIVRHLVLPGAETNTREVLRAIANIDRTLYVSLMGQYFPTNAVKNHENLGRRLTENEYDKAMDCFFDAGLKNGFSQELSSAIEEYVPDFDLDILKNILGIQ